MIIDVITVAGIVWCGSIMFHDEIATAKNAAKKAAKFTGEQMAASAYTMEGRLVKSYRTKDVARRNRVRLKVGTVVCLPNGTNITVEEGMKDVESEGWWYAWMGTCKTL